MNLTDKTSIDEVNVEDIANIEYFSLPKEENWKVSMIHEIIDTKASCLEIPGFEREELEALQLFLCTDL